MHGKRWAHRASLMALRKPKLTMALTVQRALFSGWLFSRGIIMITDDLFYNDLDIASTAARYVKVLESDVNIVITVNLRVHPLVQIGLAAGRVHLFVAIKTYTCTVFLKRALD